MRGRLLFAAGFVLIVVALIVLRDRGYLGGRQAGGPLEVHIPDAGLDKARPGQARFAPFDVRLRGGAVRVQNVRARIVSPELEVIGPTLERGGPLEGAEVTESQDGRVGLRAQRAGFYYAVGLVVDYRRGQRRFRDRGSPTLCLAVREKAGCDVGYDGPGDARVAQVGGPSRYRHARLEPERALYEKPGPYGLRLTIANQTRVPINVSDLRFDDNALDVEVTATEPTSFHLTPHGYRVVKLHVRFPACKTFAVTFPRLRAQLDGEKRSIPLSLPLEFGCPAP